MSSLNTRAVPAVPATAIAPPMATGQLPGASLKWDWQQVTSQTVNSVSQLAALLELDADLLVAQTQGNDFALRVPLTFVHRMRPGNVNDPLLLQILNKREEQHQDIAYTPDPLDEHTGSPCPGIIHKYAGRVLLTVASACPINCRYCFRRHFPYDDNRLTPSTWQPALDYIERCDEISEVILSGGEPLMLKDRLLAKLLEQLQQIDHVKLIRIHSRFPIAIPQRITRELVTLLEGLRTPVILVLHSNHPNELDETVESALRPLRCSSVNLLNQTVLLKNVNDNIDVLESLSRRLIHIGVLPYYLHVLDKVSGTGHFDIGDKLATQLHGSLIDRLPGYLVPTLVREIPQRRAKTRLYPSSTS